MPESLTLLGWTAAVFIMCWMVRTHMRWVEACQSAAAQSHILAVLERERCEDIRQECRELRGECHLAAAAAHEAAADAEEFAESVEPDDDEDERERW